MNKVIDNNIKNNTGINTNTGTGTEDGAGHRLTINRSAENALTSAVERINDGFHGGKVNRNQIAIWAILQFGENLTTDEIKEIRVEHLDEFSALDIVLRRAKESGKLPPELSAFIQRQMGFDESPKKKNKKTLPDNNINDVIVENEK